MDNERLAAAELIDIWPLLSVDERHEGFRQLESEEADQFFLGLGSRDQGALLRSMRDVERRLWIRLLAPDHAADVVQTFDSTERDGLLLLLDEPTRREVVALLAYEEDHAGGLMSPRYARLRPDMLVDEAIRYLRRQAENKLETLTYAYVLEHDQHLCGVVSLRHLFTSAGDSRISEIMRSNVVTVPDITGVEDARAKANSLRRRDACVDHPPPRNREGSHLERAAHCEVFVCAADGFVICR